MVQRQFASRPASAASVYTSGTLTNNGTFTLAGTSSGWGRMLTSADTTLSGSGTTVRIDRLKGDGGGYAVYFHCQSGLVGQFRDLYPETFTYDGARAIHFDPGERVPARELRHCIALALTHHLRKKRKK